MTTRAPRDAIRVTATAVAAVAAASILTACGGSDAASDHAAPSARTRHNAQDVAFAREMIPHHRQAVAMAERAPGRAKSKEVKRLAARISQAQGPEITRLTGWLKDWGEKPADGDMKGSATKEGAMKGMPGMKHAHGSGHSSGHGSHAEAAPGMMSDAGMARLGKLSGAAFDTAFLKMMTGHHRGAVEMARTEQSKGVYRPAKALAESIVTSQSAEITKMRKILHG